MRAKPLITRHCVQRLSRDQWGDHKSIWATDLTEGQKLEVDRVTVSEEPAEPEILELLGLRPGALVCRRARRFVVNAEAVQYAVSFLPMDRVAGTRIMRENTGPGGTYARLAPLGYKPVHFREVLRFREGYEHEVRMLDMDFGSRAVIEIVRTAYYEKNGKLLPIEVTDMVLKASAYELIYAFDA